MESQVLVLRKEVKVVLAAAAGVVGIALVYGLMATLSSSGEATIDPTAHRASGDGAGTLDVTAPSDQVVSGLPPRDDASAAPRDGTAKDTSSADPFAESARNDGKSNVDWATVLNSGKVPVDATPALAGPRSHETGVAGAASANSPLVTRTPGRGFESSSGNDLANGSTVVTAAAGTYTVQAGDNFSRIAGKLYGNKNLYKVLVDANPTLDPARLKPGMTINAPAKDTLPAAAVVTTTAETRNAVDPTAAETIGAIDASKQYVIKPGDTLHKISLRLYGKTNRWSSIYDLNKEKIGPNAERLKIGTVLTLPEPPLASR